MNLFPPIVVVYTRDLFFGVRIQDVVEGFGGRVQAVQSAADLAKGLEQTPALAIVELDPRGQGDWIHAVTYARKWARGIPIAAFGSHVDAEAREAARRVGVDYVWSKSRFVTELPALVERYLAPSETMAGCQDAANDLVRTGVALFNQGQYYKCHDALEAAWVAERRPCRWLYQGLLQLAIALHHIKGGNFNGADKMFRRAINKFQRLPGRCQGFDVAWLLQTSRDLHTTLLALGPDHIADFPRARFPTISSRAIDDLAGAE